MRFVSPGGLIANGVTAGTSGFFGGTKTLFGHQNFPLSVWPEMIQ